MPGSGQLFILLQFHPHVWEIDVVLWPFSPDLSQGSNPKSIPIVKSIAGHIRVPGCVQVTGLVYMVWVIT